MWYNKGMNEHDGTKQNCCRECKNLYIRNWRVANPKSNKLIKDKSYRSRRNFVDQIKLDSGCADCGYKEFPYVLGFDHVTGDKEFDVGLRITVSMERLLKEIDKCDVVCHNCHAIRTHNRRKTKSEVTG